MKLTLSLRLLFSLTLGGLAAALSSCQSASYASPVAMAMESPAAMDAAPAPPPRFSMATRSEATPVALKLRPGLGTQAGYETWEQYGRADHFFRRNKGTPDYVASLHYNDEKGAEVLSRTFGASPRKRRGWVPLAQGLLEARITSNGRPLSYYSAETRAVVIGNPGDYYEIELRNLSKSRLEAVVSVDGIDTLSAKPASFSSGGYVVDAGSSVAIRGFRSSLSNVKRFRFGSVGDSYAVTRGGASAARNVGVIGVAFWKEDEGALRSSRSTEAWQRGDANPFPGM